MLHLSPDFEEQIHQTVGFIRRRTELSPTAGIVLGTGAGEIANSIENSIEIPYDDIPGFPKATALGHAGQLVLGQFGETPVITMQGRFHLYEGYTFEAATYPIHVMAELGIEQLMVTNAAGGLNPKFESGEVMLMESHIDLMWRSLTSFAPQPVARPSGMGRADAYDRQLIHRAIEIASAHQFPLQRGVYAALLGPNYETRAEYRMLRRIGADAAGMSTVPELTVGNYLNLKSIGFSVIANVAKPDVLTPTSGQEVIDAAIVAAPNLLTLAKGLFASTREG